MKAYFAYACVTIRSRLSYLKPFLLSQIFLVVILVTFYELYSMVCPAGEMESGYTLRMLVFYIAIAESIELSRQRVNSQISSEIKDGSCAYSLLRPKPYIGIKIAEATGGTIFSLSIILVLGMTISTLLVGIDMGIIKGLLLAFPAIFFGAAINLLAMVIFGLLAFYFEENAPFVWIYQKLVFILGGMFLPIEFFPVWLRDLSSYLPFAYVSWFPAKCVVLFNVRFFVEGIAIQLVWLFLFSCLIFLLDRAGKRRLTVNGG